MFYLIGISMRTANPITFKLKIIYCVHSHGLWILVIRTDNAIFSLMLPVDSYQTVIEVECYPINNMKVQLILNNYFYTRIFRLTPENLPKVMPARKISDSV